MIGNLLRASVVYFLFVAVITSVKASGDIVLQPTVSGSAEIAVIIIQGASIPTDRYVPLASLIQDASGYSTWIGIPAFPLDAPNPLDMSWKVSQIISQMQKAGMTTSTYFFVGHSLGGATVQDYLASNPTLATGQILMGSVINRKYNTTGYPVSTLTIGSELDGLMRITRVAESYYNLIQDQANQTEASLSFPVVVIEGADHMQFASGEPPLFVKLNDLIPEISDDEAHQLISEDIITFIQSKLSDSDASDVLLQRVEESSSFLQPIINALILEGYHNFKKPCDCKQDTCDSQPDCYGGCPWSNTAMTIMGSGLDYVTINSQDSFHKVYELQANASDPAHLPKIFDSCASTDLSCVLQTTTITQGVYEKEDELDTGFYPITASELRVKMKSRQAVYIAAGQTDVNFDVTDGPSLCAVINQQSYDYARSIAGTTTIARFDQYGEPYVMGEDVAHNAGPTWIWSALQYKESADKSNVTLISSTLKTDVDYPIKSASGYHYCKLLSPARAIEWLYVDGLRAHYSVNSNSVN